MSFYCRNGENAERAFPEHEHGKKGASDLALLDSQYRIRFTQFILPALFSDFLPDMADDLMAGIYISKVILYVKNKEGVYDKGTMPFYMNKYHGGAECKKIMGSDFPSDKFYCLRQLDTTTHYYKVCSRYIGAPVVGPYSVVGLFYGVNGESKCGPNVADDAYLVLIVRPEAWLKNITDTDASQAGKLSKEDFYYCNLLSAKSATNSFNLVLILTATGIWRLLQ